jgi:MYXO-CTERM domain-containing protein
VGDVGRTATGGFLPGSGPEVYKYDVGGLSIPLAAGTYALCIVNDTTGNDRDWQWARGHLGGTMWTKTDATLWEQVAYSSRVAFYLTDDVPPVPEPAGLGLIGLAMLGLRRKRS